MGFLQNSITFLSDLLQYCLAGPLPAFSSSLGHLCWPQLCELSSGRPSYISGRPQKKVPDPFVAAEERLYDIWICVCTVFYLISMQILTMFAVFMLLCSGQLLTACDVLERLVRHFFCVDLTERGPRPLEVV
jgi:hypothetical protein